MYEEPENLKLLEKRLSTDTNAEMTWMLELPDKDFKAAIIKMLQQLKVDTLETNEKVDSFSKETGDKEKNKCKF